MGTVDKNIAITLLQDPPIDIFFRNLEHCVISYSDCQYTQERIVVVIFTQLSCSPPSKNRPRVMLVLHEGSTRRNLENLPYFAPRCENTSFSCSEYIKKKRFEFLPGIVSRCKNCRPQLQDTLKETIRSNSFLEQGY